MLGFAAAIGLAVPAHADSSDDTFLATVRAAGLEYSNPDQVITSGKTVCKLMNHGTEMPDIVNLIQMVNPELRGDNAAQFTAIAANSYCPQALSAAATAKTAS